MVKSVKITEPANHIAALQESSTRRVWHNEAWWFSVVDVCAILRPSTGAGFGSPGFAGINATASDRGFPSGVVTRTTMSPAQACAVNRSEIIAR